MECDRGLEEKVSRFEIYHGCLIFGFGGTLVYTVMVQDKP